MNHLKFTPEQNHEHPNHEVKKPPADAWRDFWNRPKKQLIPILLGGFFLLLGGGTLFAILIGVPGIEEIKNLSLSENSIIYDSTGEVALYSIHGEENRKYVSISEISPNMVEAILASEDADFYNHAGVDFNGMLRSVYFLARTGEIRGGGSTLTQQFARNALLTLDQTFVRKFREIYLSFRIENNFSKDEILELYLNKIPFGNNAHGIERASKVYFGKSAKDLTLAESVVLASLPQAPSRWSPYGPNKESTLNVTPEVLAERNITTEADFKKLETEDFSPVKRGLLGRNIEISPGVTIYAEGRTDYVLGQMKEKGFITDLEFKKTKEDLQKVVFNDYKENIDAEHFVFYVRDILENELGKDVLEQAGLKIYTTLDYKLQKEAEKMALAQAEVNKSYDVSNIALIAAEPSTGHIKAMVGSRDYWDEEIDGKVNVVLQRRQPGSSFKPITYAASFLNGLAPATVLFDVETKFGSTTPQNFDGTFRGPVTIRKALGNSLNIPALKAGILAGDGKVYETAKKLGIEFSRDAEFYGASIAIGSAEAEPIEMLQAYSVFATGGKKIPPTPILWVEDKDGNILIDHREPLEDPEEALDPETAYLVTDVLSDADSRGPGWNARLQMKGRKNAVKTGTSNAVDPATGIKYPNDNWTIGYTPQLATVVWAGNNRGFVKSQRADGFNNAAPLWMKFMEYYHQGKPALEFEKPANLKTIAVDRFSGKLPSPEMGESFLVKEIFSPINAPTETSDVIKFVKVDKITGRAPNEFTPPDAISLGAILNFHSERPNDPNWEVPVQNWVNNNAAGYLAQFGIQIYTGRVGEEGIDDEHNAETAAKKPTVSILSPTNFGVVTPPVIDVFPDVTAGNGLRFIEVYWDGELKKTISTSPWHTSIGIGSPESGSTHTLRVKAVDRLYYADESEISVKIGEDSTAPQITFLSPRDGETISGGGLQTFRVNAVDQSSSVNRVTFHLNGQNIGSDNEAPFEIRWDAPNENEDYELSVRASDTAGNTSESSVSFETKKGSSGSSGGGSFGIYSPRTGAELSSPVSVSVGITEEQSDNFGGLEIWFKSQGGNPKILQSFSEGELPNSGIFSAIWETIPGDYEIWAKVLLSSGGTQISQKVTVSVQ